MTDSKQKVIDEMLIAFYSAMNFDYRAMGNREKYERCMEAAYNIAQRYFQPDAAVGGDVEALADKVMEYIPSKMALYMPDDPGSYKWARTIALDCAKAALPWYKDKSAEPVSDVPIVGQPSEAMCDEARGFIMGLDLKIRAWGEMQRHLDAGGYPSLPRIKERAETAADGHITKWDVAECIWQLMARAHPIPASRPEPARAGQDASAWKWLYPILDKLYEAAFTEGYAEAQDDDAKADKADADWNSAQAELLIALEARLAKGGEA